MHITGHRNRTFVLAHRGELRVNCSRWHLSSQSLLQENRPRVLVLDEGADRAAAGTTQPSKFFEASEHLRQPGFQHRAFDLSDIPVQYQKRDSADFGDREESDSRRVIVGASL